MRLGEPDLSYYRLYFLNSDNRISRFVELFHESDEGAIEDARRHAEGQQAELWNRDRLVARLGADGRVPADAGAVQVPAA